MSQNKNHTQPQPHVIERQMVDSYIKSIALNDTAQQVADIMLLVDNPFVDVKTNDAISLIFHRFYKHTNSHPALPIFTFLAMISAWCVENRATCQIPLTKKPTELDTWVLLLADTGATKSLSASIISDAMPKNLETGRPLVESNFVMPASNASFVQQLVDLPNHRGYWKQDESSQFIKQIDQNTGALAGINGTMLMTKDHGTIGYGTKANNLSIEGPVLTVLMINTINSMISAMSEESMQNGMFRRFTTAWAGKDTFDTAREFGDIALYDIKEMADSILEDELAAIFGQDIADKNYTFSPACERLYKSTFKTFWERQYQRFLSEHEVYYRTYMMEAWRYAVFHHVLHKKPGSIVDEYSLQWGLKVSMFLLNSLQHYIDRKSNRAEVPAVKEKIEKFMDFIRENEHKDHFGMRAVCRKFTMSKAEVFSMLATIKIHNPKFKTALFEELKKSGYKSPQPPKQQHQGVETPKPQGRTAQHFSGQHIEVTNDDFFSNTGPLCIDDLITGHRDERGNSTYKGL